MRWLVPGAFVLTLASCSADLGAWLSWDELVGTAVVAVVGTEGTPLLQAEIVRDFGKARSFPVTEDTEVFMGLYDQEPEGVAFLPDGKLEENATGALLPKPDRIFRQVLVEGSPSGPWEPRSELGPRLRTIRVPKVDLCVQLQQTLVRSPDRQSFAIERASPRSVFLAQSGEDTLRLFEISVDGSVQRLASSATVAASYHSVALFGPSGTLAFASNLPGDANIHLGPKERLQRLPPSGETDHITGLAFSPNGQVLWVSWANGRVRSFENGTFGPPLEAEANPEGIGGSVLSTNDDTVTGVRGPIPGLFRIQDNDVSSLDTSGDLSDEITHVQFLDPWGWLVGAYNGSVYRLEGSRLSPFIRSTVGVSRVTTILPMKEGLLVSGYWSWIRQAYPSTDGTLAECDNAFQALPNAHIGGGVQLDDNLWAVYGTPIFAESDDVRDFVAFLSRP